MLQVDFIKNNFSKVIDSLKKRNKDYSSELKKIIDFNESRKKQQTKLDTLLSEVNNLSKQIGELFKNDKDSLCFVKLLKNLLEALLILKSYL